MSRRKDRQTIQFQFGISPKDKLQAYAPLACELARMEMTRAYGVRGTLRDFDPQTGIVFVHVSLNPMGV